MASQKQDQGIAKKMIFGAAVVYTAFWINGFLPFPQYLSIPVSGALSILVVELIVEAIGFFFI